MHRKNLFTQENNKDIEVFWPGGHENTLHERVHTVFNDLICQLHQSLHLLLFPVAMNPESWCSHCAHFVPHQSDQLQYGPCNCESSLRVSWDTCKLDENHICYQWHTLLWRAYVPTFNLHSILIFPQWYLNPTMFDFQELKSFRLLTRGSKRMADVTRAYCLHKVGHPLWIAIDLQSMKPCISMQLLKLKHLSNINSFLFNMN